MFIDRVRLWARAGKGGNGCCSFRREKYVPKGGPDGGDGGKGGDVILQVNAHRNNLEHLRFKPHCFAMDGQPGRNQKKTGRNGKDKILEVPPGTVIYQLLVDEENFARAASEEGRIEIVDLVKPNTTYVLCEGGKGGAGNVHFKSSVNQAPRRFTAGFPGDWGQFIFELKSIADVGLVGFPNAGKSSLLRAVSAARPKVGAYPFTTLQPMIGMIEFGGFERLSMADIPGLIEGAHEGVGLGHDFLKHIERCRVLAMVLDMAGSEGRNPMDDFNKLREEISLYSQSLKQRPYFVIANKMDLPGAEENLKSFTRHFDRPVISVSATQVTGIQELKEFLERHELFTSTEA